MWTVDDGCLGMCLVLHPSSPPAAQLFEKGKEKLGGIHFLALQESPESEGVDGFFMLKERMSSL